MHIKTKNLYMAIATFALLGGHSLVAQAQQYSGNPLFPGHYADPEMAVVDHQYWIFPTTSKPYEEQVYFDAFSSRDLVHWTKHPDILDSSRVHWAHKAMWAPAFTEKDGKYYFFFGANDIQSNQEKGGIGIAVADHPSGPYRDYLGRPLVDSFANGAQPIDQFVFKDKDGAYYLIYGGWRHCNIARLKNDFTGFVPGLDGKIFTEITPKGYVEGPLMFMRKGKYYFMWSEGTWTGPDYTVAYAIGDSPMGPFTPEGKILLQDTAIATGAGHHSVLQQDGKWYITYHRRPKGSNDPHAREVSMEEFFFDKNDKIIPVKISLKGVKRHVVK